ncbi:aminotransferase class V-fold PLP-dependent enzyme [Pseudomonas granadensis]|uniref:aminotransferase class V-fold PLP-dependent enzyme n=1 Tax=Pseudomonas granadensis TaxID=1421430 RepID=UPI0019D1829D|nr:aminotransferase class V-fold PLP-dependent enzyme [Pseudomonas granadensis]MBN6776153.1 aminotransferase class V-fold PLP-dependent enzyme [Pseudomonas granadensis]MBN6807171.1 aminotransferase class V-fold PLP-dependent enzyme [Pseudomonas granadensis]MBN6833981.1 aminotransferase class V-fold PLP-dependent enzyme [Pseudomonas granadensis]MBN6841546.1 aminotransferase class V-fold PLP-dependent enzyme [Pseudomonas granadensis]MBN6870169.1 aminotransferase class V-fold PLP-dependent enzyme
MIAGLASAQAAQAPAHNGTTTPLDPADWASVRAQFTLSPQFVHISNFFLASNPKPVREAMARHRQAFDENPYTYLEDNMFARPDDMVWRKVCAAAAEYTGGRAEDIALTTSTTQGLAMIYNGLKLEPTQEILTTHHEWYTHDEAMRLAVVKWGGSIRRIDLYEGPEDVSVDAIVARIETAIRPTTRILAMTWVHSGTGVRLPVKEIGALVARLNQDRTEADRIIYVIDGVHGFGCSEAQVASLGCDFFSAGTHKWILGPHGTGLVWAREGQWAQIVPTIPTIMAAEPGNAWRELRDPQGETQAAWVSPGGFLAFENQWGVIEAFEFIKKIGRKRIADRVAELNGQLKEGLAALPNVYLHTPRAAELSAGIVCCDVKGSTPREIVAKLKAHNIIASATPYRHSTVRFSAGIINTAQDIDRTLEVMRTLV